MEVPPLIDGCSSSKSIYGQNKKNLETSRKFACAEIGQYDFRRPTHIEQYGAYEVLQNGVSNDKMYVD